MQYIYIHNNEVITMRYEKIHKETRSKIEAKLKAIIRIYGYADTRCVINKEFARVKEEWKLKQEISKAELKLKTLQNKKRCR